MLWERLSAVQRLRNRLRAVGSITWLLSLSAWTATTAYCLLTAAKTHRTIPTTCYLQHRAVLLEAIGLSRVNTQYRQSSSTTAVQRMRIHQYVQSLLPDRFYFTAGPLIRLPYNTAPLQSFSSTLRILPPPRACACKQRFV